MLSTFSHPVSYHSVGRWAVVARFEFGVGRDLLVQQPRGVGNPGQHRRVRVRFADGVDEMLAGGLLEEVEDGLERVELVCDGGVAVGQPADGGAERPADGLDFALLAEFVKRLQHVGSDLVDVGVVEHQELDVVHPQPVERAVQGGANPLGRDLLGQFAVARLRVVVEVVADLGGDGHFVPDLRERVADEFLAVAVAVDVTGVEKGDVPVDGVLDHLNSLLARSVAPPVRPDDPGTEADLRDFDSRVPERVVLHAAVLGENALIGLGSPVENGRSSHW